MPDARLRVRVERLLKGDFRVDDLSTLFLTLRNRSNCPEVVREIGDFVAHQDERTKGITTDSVRDFFTTLRYQLQFNLRGVPFRTPYDLPHNIADVLWAVFRRVPSKTITQATGLKRAAAERALQDLSGRICHLRGGTTWLDRPTSQDRALIRRLLTVIISTPAFTHDGLALHVAVKRASPSPPPAPTMGVCQWQRNKSTA
jgi:hypothetical protein